MTDFKRPPGASEISRSADEEDDDEEEFHVYSVEPEDGDVGIVQGDGPAEYHVFFLCDNENRWGISMSAEQARELASWLTAAADVVEEQHRTPATTAPGGDA